MTENLCRKAPFTTLKQDGESLSTMGTFVMCHHFCLAAFLVGLAVAAFADMPAHAQTWTGRRQPNALTVRIEIGPGPVETSGDPGMRGLALANLASRKRQEAFDTRLAASADRATASLCIGCGAAVRAPLADRGQTLSLISRVILPDSDALYSPQRGFDPAQAFMN